VLKSDGLLYLCVKQGDTEKFVQKNEYKGHTKFFSFYNQEEFNTLIESCGFKVVKLWVDEKKDTWINIFATVIN